MPQGKDASFVNMTDSMSVSELNEYTKRLLENDILLQMVNVSGEISNFKRHQSGHIYFTLKDEKSKINCSFFKNYNFRLKFEPKDGMFVTVSATASLYVRDGAYQLYVYSMSEQGTGRLYELFEKMKNKLREEGLFDESIKKPIPEYPKRVAVLTSPTGAAIRDIISVTGRRAKNTEIVIVPVPVQGEGAAQQIAKALSYADTVLNADTIIIARGGGSIEELWAFNEEILARAIYNCNTPVISGVGHETDFTICDFAADKRAPTPSAAAEIAVQDCTDISAEVNNLMKNIEYSLNYKLESCRQKVSYAMKGAAFSSVLHNIQLQRQRQDIAFDEIQWQIEQKINRTRERINNCLGNLEAMNPYNVLRRGYAVALDKNGRRILDSNDVNISDDIKVELSSGELVCTVKEIVSKCAEEE